MDGRLTPTRAQQPENILKWPVYNSDSPFPAWKGIVLIKGVAKFAAIHAIGCSHVLSECGILVVPARVPQSDKRTSQAQENGVSCFLGMATFHNQRPTYGLYVQRC